MAQRITNQNPVLLRQELSGRQSAEQEHGFDDRKCARLLALLKRKLEYVDKHFEHDRSFEWIGGYNFIVTGVKAGV